MYFKKFEKYVFFRIVFSVFFFIIRKKNKKKRKKKKKKRKKKKMNADSDNKNNNNNSNKKIKINDDDDNAIFEELLIEGLKQITHVGGLGAPSHNQPEIFFQSIGLTIKYYDDKYYRATKDDKQRISLDETIATQEYFDKVNMNNHTYNEMELELILDSVRSKNKEKVYYSAKKLGVINDMVMQLEELELKKKELNESIAKNVKQLLLDEKNKNLL